MKLIVKRNDQGEVEMQMTQGAATIEFSYVEMIKGILNGDNLEPTQYDDSITEDEREAMDELIGTLNDTIEESRASTDEEN